MLSQFYIKYFLKRVGMCVEYRVVRTWKIATGNKSRFVWRGKRVGFTLFHVQLLESRHQIMLSNNVTLYSSTFSYLGIKSRRIIDWCILNKANSHLRL